MIYFFDLLAYNKQQQSPSFICQFNLYASPWEGNHWSTYSVVVFILICLKDRSQWLLLFIHLYVLKIDHNSHGKSNCYCLLKLIYLLCCWIYTNFIYLLVVVANASFIIFFFKNWTWNLNVEHNAKCWEASANGHNLCWKKRWHLLLWECLLLCLTSL